MPKKLTYEEVKEFLKTKGITLLSNGYENANAHLDLKCDVCGYEWSTTYNCIQQGTGCPKCGGTLKLTYEEVKAFIETKGITLLSNEYENANAHLDLKCDVCGFEWQAVYGSIQQDHGCPKCAIKRRSEKRITDIEEACKKVGFRVM